MSEGSIIPYFEYIPIFVCNPLHGSDVNFFGGEHDVGALNASDFGALCIKA